MNLKIRSVLHLQIQQRIEKQVGLRVKKVHLAEWVKLQKYYSKFTEDNETYSGLKLAKCFFLKRYFTISSTMQGWRLRA